MGNRHFVKCAQLKIRKLYKFKNVIDVAFFSCQDTPPSQLSNQSIVLTYKFWNCKSGCFKRSEKCIGITRGTGLLPNPYREKYVFFRKGVLMRAFISFLNDFSNCVRFANEFEWNNDFQEEVREYILNK